MKYTELDIMHIKTSAKHSKERCKSGEGTSLAKNIAKIGVIAPIYVKPLMGGGYEIVSGNRRFCAARLAGKRKIPCFVLEKGEDPWAIAITMSRYNSHDPFELAQNIKNLLIKTGSSAEELATRLGMETGEFLEYLAPICMSEVERRISRENSISEKSVRKIALLPTREERFEILSRYIKANEAPKRITTSKQAVNARARRRVSIKGLGFFENTLKRSIELLESAGMQAEKTAEENNTYNETENENFTRSDKVSFKNGIHINAKNGDKVDISFKDGINVDSYDELLSCTNKSTNGEIVVLRKSFEALSTYKNSTENNVEFFGKYNESSKRKQITHFLQKLLDIFHCLIYNSRVKTFVFSLPPKS